MNRKLNHEYWALDELLEELRLGEELQYVVFNEPEMVNIKRPNGEDLIPENLVGIKIPLEKARKYFYGWNISGGFGSAGVVPFFAWTNKRVLFIGTYDGSTWLESIPLSPCDILPFTVGGG